MSVKAKIFFILLSAICIYLSFNLNRREARGVIYSDPEGYYMYLPAVFIYDGFENIPIQSNEFKTYAGTDKVFTKYTYGVALFELPFFLVAHVFANLTDYPEDGYSYPYRVAIMFSAIFYLLVSFYLLYKLLNPYFSENVVLSSLFILFFGTNLFFYTLRSPGAAHIYIFFQFTLLLYLTPRVLKSNSVKLLFIYFLLYGLIVITRPSNGIIILLPLLFDINSINKLPQRIRHFLGNFKSVFIALLCLAVVALPQLIYWKYISGNWIIYSYENQGFDYWKNPQIINVLFNVWSGWFIYTPLALLLVIELVRLSLKNKFNSKLVLGILSIATYIFASWWYWWFGGSFGHRCYVEYYSLLTFAGASLIFNLSKIKLKPLRFSLFLLIGVLCYYNIAFTYMYSPPWDGADWTWESYFEVLTNAFTLNFVK